MRIFDEANNLLESVDMGKGRLVQDRLFLMHHDAVEAVEEQGHFETIKEYPNGGKDVDWVVDVPAMEAKEAYDEYEDILRFVAYTAQELATAKITELKQKLSETDYNILKIIEGATTVEACADVIKRRAEWRKEINELEKEL